VLNTLPNDNDSFLDAFDTKEEGKPGDKFPVNFVFQIVLEVNGH